MFDVLFWVLDETPDTLPPEAQAAFEKALAEGRVITTFSGVRSAAGEGLADRLTSEFPMAPGELRSVLKGRK